MIWLVVAVALVSLASTGAALEYARRRGLLDHPTERSSHAVATPRGGGIAIAVATLGGITVAASLAWIPGRVALALAGGGALVAAIGWMDDRHGVAAYRRLLVHAAAAAWAVTLLGPLRGLGVVGAVLAGLAIVWAVNLYNFMDGVDGLAASEAVTVSAAAAALLATGGQAGMALAAMIVGAGAAGFLPWNWPPARMFMGDVGSGLLGFLFGTLALAAHNLDALPVGFWLVLLGVFVFDATVTLLRRATAGEPITTAHRRHAYQRLVQAGWTHRRVTVAAVATNLVLALVAWGDWRAGGSGARAVAAAMLLLACLYLWVERVAPLKYFAQR